MFSHDPNIVEALAAGARMTNTNRRDGRDPYSSERQVATFRRGVAAMLEDLDGSMTLSELREQLEEAS